MSEDDLFFNTMEFSELRKKYELLEVNLHKFEIENTKKNKEIQRLQEELQKYRKLTNDASTDYPWPEEFCDRWKKLFESTIMESFDNIFYTNILLVRVINIIVKIVYDLSKEKIIEKIKLILNCFGVENINDDSIKIFFQKFQFSIFQDYFKTIIKFDDILLNKILLNIRLEIGTKKGILFTESEIEEINKDLYSKQMNFFLKELFILSLYMHFHDPLLSIKTSTELNYCYFSKKDFISLDGFGKENSVCLIILSPPVLRFNIYFKKLVPIVFICENPTDEIIKQCELKKFYQLRKTQSKSFNIVNNSLIYNLQNQNNNDELNTINNDKIENEKDYSQSQSPLNNTNNNTNGIFNISNFTSVTTGTSNPSNRNIQNANFKNFFNSNSIINNNNNEKNKNINNIYDQLKDSRYKSANKMNQNKENNYIKNQEHLFKNKQQQNMKKQINNNTGNESIISQNDISNINQSKQNEKHIFNVINNIKSQNNNIKKDKSFSISATEEINFDDQSPSNILRLKREIELKNIKSKLSIDKIDNHSRNNSTFEFDGNNNSNRVKDNNFENYPIKLFTEIHSGYSPSNQNYLQTPIQKKRTNSIGSQSEKSGISNEQNLKFINQNLITNQRKIKTTIRKVNNNENSFLRKNISSIDQNNINEQNIENYSTSEIKMNNNNNNDFNNNYNNNNNNKGNKNNNTVNNINNKNKEKVDLYKMEVSGNNNFESASYRNSAHNLLRNNSQSNCNKSHDISSNSICSNHGNSKELKSTFPGSSNNFIINNNMNLQNNVINKNLDIYKHKNNINKESLSNIVFNSKKGFDYSNNQPIKTDYDNYVTNNTIEGHPLKNEENSTLNSNRVGNSSNIKNSFFSTNDIKSMKIFNKNEILKKGNKNLIGKKNESNFGNVDIQQVQNSRIKSPSFKNSINNKNNNNNGFNTKSPKKNFNMNNTSTFTSASNKFLNDKKFHTNNQLNKFKKK